LKPVRDKFNDLIYISMFTPIQLTLHGRRVFEFLNLLPAKQTAINLN